MDNWKKYKYNMKNVINPKAASIYGGGITVCVNKSSMSQDIRVWT